MLFRSANFIRLSEVLLTTADPLAARGRAAGRRRTGMAASFGLLAVQAMQASVKDIRDGEPAVRPCIWGRGSWRSACCADA